MTCLTSLGLMGDMLQQWMATYFAEEDRMEDPLIYQKTAFFMKEGLGLTLLTFWVFKNGILSAGGGQIRH